MRTEGGGFDVVEGGVVCAGAGCTGGIHGTGAGGVAGASCAGARAGRGDELVAFSGNGLETEKYTFEKSTFEESESRIRIGITHGTSGSTQVTSRENTTFPVSSSKRL